MIRIKNKKNCCGCSACMSACPKHCITMVEDVEGFTYPSVDFNKCINCGLCEKVCPIINPYETSKPIRIYAAKSVSEEIVATSSSGGMFMVVAENTIEKGGVVFGAKFNDQWQVCHPVKHRFPLTGRPLYGRIN